MLEEIFEKFLSPDYFDSIAFVILPIILMIINVWLVISSNNKQISNQNRMTYKPRLTLDPVICPKDFEPNIYEFSIDGKDAVEVFRNSKDEFVTGLSISSFKAILPIANIGNGIATDITFYNFISGDHVYRSLSIQKEKGTQQSMSTIEIPINGKIGYQFNLLYFDKEKEKALWTDFYSILCLYSDVNSNRYKMLISLRICKETDVTERYINYSYYQEDSPEFKVIRRENKKTMCRIIRQEFARKYDIKLKWFLK